MQDAKTGTAAETGGTKRDGRSGPRARRATIKGLLSRDVFL